MDKRDICQFLAQFDGRPADKKLLAIPFEQQIEFMVNKGYIRIDNFNGFRNIKDATISITDAGWEYYKKECDL